VAVAEGWRKAGPCGLDMSLRESEEVEEGRQAESHRIGTLELHETGGSIVCLY